jgi:hypothetical protein
MVDDPCLLSVVSWHVTVSRRGVVEVEVATTWTDPEPVNS